jgi:predicted transcriptional regulator
MPEVVVTARKKKEFREHQLSRRELQIMRAVYRMSRATVAEIVDSIPDPPTPDAVRRLCHILEEKGHLKVGAEGPAKVYEPTVAASRARQNALENVMDTFFAGSPHRLVAALLDAKRDQLSPEDVERLTRMIEDAAKEAEKEGES